MSTWWKVKIRRADKLMSQYIKARDKNLCQYNFKCFRGELGSQNSHFQKRRHESVRFDPENCDWVCAKCHYFVETHPDGQKTLEKWKLKQLGEQKYNWLMIRTQTYQKKDDTIQILVIKELAKSLKN